eukprot:2756062-Pyramimonas_sp.AAC.1
MAAPRRPQEYMTTLCIPKDSGRAQTAVNPRITTTTTTTTTTKTTTTTTTTTTTATTTITTT